MKTKWFSTLIEKLDQQNEKRPKETALKIHKKSGKENITFGELWNGSHNIAQKLKEEGVEKQSRVAIFGEHSISWALIFVASRRLGATVTPIDINHNGKEIESQLKDCEPDIIIYAKKDVGSEPHQDQALTESGFKSKPMSEMAYVLERKSEANKESEANKVSKTKENKNSIKVQPEADREEDEESEENLIKKLDIEKPEVDQLISPPKEYDDDIALLAYTSGTTGDPKGVQLTIANLAFNINNLRIYLDISSDDVFGHIAPPFHVMGANLLFMLPIRVGATSLFLDKYMATSSLLEEIGDNNVSIFLGVPLLYKKFLQKLEKARNLAYSIPHCFTEFKEKRAEDPESLTSDLWGLAKSLGKAALKTSGISKIRKKWNWRHPKVALNAASEHFKKIILGLLYPRLPKASGWLLRKKLGSQFRIFASGSAPLSPHTYDGFARLGFEIRNGWGMSELSPLITMPLKGRTKRDSVGIPLPGISIMIVVRDRDTGELLRIAKPHEEGEILVGGMALFPSYLNSDYGEDFVTLMGRNYFRTGDIGFIDRDGHVHISGREDNRIVPPGGERFSAENIENEIFQTLNSAKLVEKFFVRGVPEDDSEGEKVQIVIEPSFKTAIERNIDNYEQLASELKNLWQEASTELPHKKTPKSMLIVGEMPLTGNMDIKRGTVDENEEELAIKDDGSYLKYLVSETKYSEEQINDKVNNHEKKIGSI